MQQTQPGGVLDPAFQGFVDVFPIKDVDAANLDGIRQLLAAMAEQVEVDESGIETTHQMIENGSTGETFRCRIDAPQTADGLRPAILFIHGGGYVMGLPELAKPQLLGWARQLGAVVVSPAYSLAPERPFPAGLEDCYATLRWLWDNAERLSVDRNRIAVAGDSAGGGLAAALALVVRDRGEFCLCFQHLLYPMLDDRTCMEPDPAGDKGRYVWTPRSNRFGWQSYLCEAPGAASIDSLAAPARAADLSGLPPAFIAVGTSDLFAEENLDYARRLLAAGVETEFHLYPGAPHGFHAVAEAATAQAYHAASLRSLARALSS